MKHMKGTLWEGHQRGRDCGKAGVSLFLGDSQKKVVFLLVCLNQATEGSRSPQKRHTHMGVDQFFWPPNDQASLFPFGCGSK